MIRNIIIKVSLECNINCRYCYVQRNREYLNKTPIMQQETLDALIKKAGEYINTHRNLDRFVFYWHGGEPLLAGTHFFEKAYELQNKYIPKGINIINTIQTNAISLSENWIATLKRIHYGICLSLDGFPEINDKWRRTKNDEGTHDLVISSIELLQKHNIPISLLAVITPDALPYGREIYQHFRKLGIGWMDFMYPFSSKIDNTLDQSIDPTAWGKFYAEVFDAWIDEGNDDIYVRLLHDLCMLCLGGRTSMCISNSDCSYVITVDPTGNIYICDDLLAYTDSLLGNIIDNSLDEVENNRILKSLSSKSVLFGEDCLECDYFRFCRGGCTLFRALEFGNFHGKHYFCSAQRYIIDHILQYFYQYDCKSVGEMVHF